MGLILFSPGAHPIIPVVLTLTPVGLTLTPAALSLIIQDLLLQMEAIKLLQILLKLTPITLAFGPMVLSLNGTLRLGLLKLRYTAVTPAMLPLQTSGLILDGPHGHGNTNVSDCAQTCP